MDAGFNKSNVRELARRWNLSNAEKPAAPCLASRMPVGTEVSPERLAQVEAVEEFLRLHDIWPARARWHETIVRLEIPAELFESELPKGALAAMAAVVRSALKVFAGAIETIKAAR